jgi:hypothetical protein
MLVYDVCSMYCSIFCLCHYVRLLLFNVSKSCIYTVCWLRYFKIITMQLFKCSVVCVTFINNAQSYILKYAYILYYTCTFFPPVIRITPTGMVHI